VLAGALELFLVSLGLTYYIATVGAGLRVIRRARKARRAQAARLAEAERAATALAGSTGLAGHVPGRRAQPGSRRRASARRPASPRPSSRHGAPGQAGAGRRAARRAAGSLDEAALSATGPAAAPPATAPAADLAGSVSARWGRLRTKLETADDPPARAGVLIPAEECVVYYVIPCLNEELVIGDTVRSLLTDPRGLVVIVDDASDDRTGELAAAAGGDRALVVRRELPEARLGKGPALNAGFARVLHDAGVRGIPSARITVCVMDADGRLSEGALDVVLPIFEDPRVGGVQLPVRIRNRNSLLTVMQDLEFWGVCAVAQLGRMACGTVSLGGNGQFTRLTALLEMGATPWQAQLTEDLDLSLALAAKGWRLTSAPDAYVSQQGVTSLRALINQRTRWYQGHMQAVRWLRELWSSRQLSHLAMLELTIYLLVPWALVLPWSIIFNYNLLIMILWVLGWVATPGLGSTLTQKIATLAFWYILSCLPVYMAGFLYGRQERKVGYVRAFFIGHLLLVGNYVTYVACWRAMYRLITGAHGWEKTRRTDERHASTPPAASFVPALAVPATAVIPAVPSLSIPSVPARAAGRAGAALTTAAGSDAELTAALPGAALATAALPDAVLATGALSGPELAILALPGAAMPMAAVFGAELSSAARPAAEFEPAAVLGAGRAPAAVPGGAAPDGAAWFPAARLADRRAAGPLAARFADRADERDLAPAVAAEALDLVTRVPLPRPPALDAPGWSPRAAWPDHDATTADLPVITDPILDAPAVSAAAAGPGAAGVPTAFAPAFDVTAADAAVLGRAVDDGDFSTPGGDGLARDLPVRRPGARSGPGQPRRPVGSHRAVRARPAQRSGR
jgi:1,2-diacylglycerol 3-beta-glucosyltransferase